MSFSDTFSPVNVAADRDELGREKDYITEGVNNLSTTPVQVPAPAAEAEAEAPVMEEEAVAPSFSDQFIETPTAPFSSQFTSETGQSLGGDPLDSVKAQFPSWPNLTEEEGERFSQLAEDAYDQKEYDDNRAEFKSLVSSSLEPGSYSPDDIEENDELYQVAYDFVEDRYGLQAVEGESRKDIVEKFLFNRRSVAISGNSVRVLNETEHVWDVMDDPERKAKLARGYAMYENMAGITSEETSWAELGWASLDVLQSVVLDPINLVGAGAGKLAGGAAIKTGSKGLEKFIIKEAQAQIAKGISVEAIQAGATSLTRVAAANAAREGAAEVARFAVTTAATTGGRRILTRAGLSEVAAATFVDAVAGSGAEFLYQQQLVDTGVQEDVNPYSVGLAALGGLVIGGAQAGRLASRGFSDTALVSEVVTQGSMNKVGRGISASMRKFFADNANNGTSWAHKTSGTELNVQDTDFFLELLNGISDAQGNVQLKGIAQTMQEEGFYYIPRNDEDKITNWIADYIGLMDKAEVQDIVKAFEDSSGVKLDGLKELTTNGVTETLKEVTSESFAQAFSTKISNVARSLASVSQAGRTLDPGIEMTTDKFLQQALDMGLIASGSKVAKSKTMEAITAGQNRFIRALVSHPSTSLLNVLGYGVSSGMGSMNDLVGSAIGFGVGTIEELVGMSAKGASRKRVASAVMRANASRIKLLLDPDMTAAAFQSALLRNSGALDRLSKIQSGGVDVAVTVEDILGRSRVGQGVENYIDVAQTATFVHAQDVFTKSQEYVFQMDKGLRVLYGKSWNEFYTSAGAGKAMAGKAYKALEEGAVAKVMEHTFSKSYKGKGMVGEVAGAIEDMRNIPGIGMLVPFGRFFNNTVDFTIKNTPLLNQAVKKLGGKYPDKTHKELLRQSAIAGGLIYSMSRNEQEKRKQGLGMYDSIDPSTGEVFSQQYDYPLSLFIAVGRWGSYWMNGEEVPLEVVQQLGKDFGGGGLTRNLTDTLGITVDAVVALAQGEIEKSLDLGKDVVSGVGSQLVSGFTRSFEPLDVAVGIVAGTEMRPQNIKDGNAFIGKSLSYIDNITQLFLGEPLNEVQVSSSEGERDTQITKQFGARVVRPTQALRLLNLLAYNSWEFNEDFIASKLAPGASNESHRMMFEGLNKLGTQLMSSKEFRTMSLKQQRQWVDEQVVLIRDVARSRLAFEYTGAQSTFAGQLELTGKYTPDQLREGMSTLNYDEGLGGLSNEQILILKTHLDSQETIDALSLHRAR